MSSPDPDPDQRLKPSAEPVAGPAHRSTPVHSLGVQKALAAVWALMATDYGLLPQLPADAALVRADGGELVTAAPRLLELTVDQQVTVEQACEVTARLGRHRWTSTQQAAIESVLDAWWLETLMRAPGEHRFPFTPDVVLGVLAGYDAPMVRWLDPWLAQLDGHGAAHLAAILLGHPATDDGPSDREPDGSEPDGSEPDGSEPDGSEPDGTPPAASGLPGTGSVRSAAVDPDWAAEPADPVLPDGPAWAGKGDQAQQVVAWARTETVITGLALVGGAHLDAGMLSDVLDRLI